MSNIIRKLWLAYNGVASPNNHVIRRGRNFLRKRKSIGKDDLDNLDFVVNLSSVFTEFN